MIQIKKQSPVLLGLMAMLAALLAVVVMPSPPANAACGGAAEITTSVSTGTDNLKIAGRPVRGTLVITKQDCDGYDLLTGMYARVTKGNGSCATGPAGLGWTTDAYRVNPNAIGGYDGPEQRINCVGGTTSYVVFYSLYKKITSSMPSAARCVAMHLTVDIVAAADTNLDTEPICFNGL